MVAGTAVQMNPSNSRHDKRGSKARHKLLTMMMRMMLMMRVAVVC